VFQRELSNRQVAYLQDYVRERASNVDRRFSNLTALHKAAGEELERRINRLSDADVARLADEYFPRQPDGTRRSRDKYFTGHLDGSEYTYGMGAFVGDADHVPMDQLRALVASFELVGDFGQAARGTTTFYFFTPATRLVMYGPDRPDHLMFYRHDAPADLSIAQEEMAQITLPANDPMHVTRCTNLQRLIQDKVGKRLATGCLTPAYANGRHVGRSGPPSNSPASWPVR
jgi:hypothetical protein